MTGFGKCPVCGAYRVYLKFEARWVCSVDREHAQPPDDPAEEGEPE